VLPDQQPGLDLGGLKLSRKVISTDSSGKLDALLWTGPFVSGELLDFRLCVKGPWKCWTIESIPFVNYRSASLAPKAVPPAIPRVKTAENFGVNAQQKDRRLRQGIIFITMLSSSSSNHWISATRLFCDDVSSNQRPLISFIFAKAIGEQQPKSSFFRGRRRAYPPRNEKGVLVPYPPPSPTAPHPQQHGALGLTDQLSMIDGLRTKNLESEFRSGQWHVKLSHLIHPHPHMHPPTLADN